MKIVIRRGFVALALAGSAFAGPASAQEPCQVGELTAGALQSGTIGRYGTQDGSELEFVQFTKVLETESNIVFTAFTIVPADQSQDVEAFEFRGRSGRLGGLLRVDNGRRAMFGDYRTREYSGDPLSQIEALEPGENIALASVEHSRFNGEYRAVESPVTLTFLGCQTRELFGEPVQTRLFDIAYEVRSYNRRTQADGETLIAHQLEYSPAHGMVVSTTSPLGQLGLVELYEP